MLAILKREMQGYFTTPIGYIYLGVFFAVAGFYWFAGSLVFASSDTTLLFDNLFVVSTFLVPILTMRLFTEEKRHKTDQLLLTAPLNLVGLVAGKYLAALFVYGVGMLVTLAYAGIMSLFGDLQWSIFWGNFFGLFLLGCALIAIGTLLSALTENQVIAAVSGFAVALLLFVIDSFASIVPVRLLADFIRGVSFYARYEPFTMGLIDLTSVFFFVSVTVLFGFLTIRVLDRRRWS